ncbi:sugar phosphate isomerase/epimerase family protein [Clostridium estertheticum]|uniref:Sugar phosphate isomerase/epimerase n=1 Tax=Clostridium estertheticum TaxID=238834 RepID=A0A7Y3SUU3_9CLOT|nr:sugar phosphate isomerase/epimerase family protein [Clostridium estertheticum]NNU75741.1 sugar phosphate isomerase/epimerase [Clostridium estertheticum]WBL46429.1 sugar phosphate isomerase/epimerase [Clostridium estertheticum]
MKKIDFGMPTLIETNSIESCVKLCKELGLDFIELNMNLPQYQIESIDIQKFKSICENENIYFTIHIDENFNVCDFNNEISKAYIKTILATINIAKQLEIPVLNMHMSNGVYFTLPNEKIFLFNQYKEIYLTKLKKFREMCKKAIGDSNIKICIENCSGYKNFVLEGIELLLESNVFALTFDIGHSHSVNGIDEAFINKHIDRLYHMHVHDGKGRENHLPLGIGEINIKERIFLAREHKCRIVLEIKTIRGLKQSVDKLSNYL